MPAEFKNEECSNTEWAIFEIVTKGQYQKSNEAKRIKIERHLATCSSCKNYAKNLGYFIQ